MAWTHIEDKTHVARKPHVCELCGQAVAIGSMYVRRFGFDSEGLVIQPMHVECESATRQWDLTDWETHMIGSGEWPKYDDRGVVVQSV